VSFFSFDLQLFLVFDARSFSRFRSFGLRLRRVGSFLQWCVPGSANCSRFPSLFNFEQTCSKIPQTAFALLIGKQIRFPWPRRAVLSAQMRTGWNLTPQSNFPIAVDDLAKTRIAMRYSKIFTIRTMRLPDHWK
jgi:hypothetical protein